MPFDEEIFRAQQEVCHRFRVDHFPAASTETLGIALNVRNGLVPLNGLRHPPDRGTCGWFVWAGETFSEAEDFFEPLHVAHVPEWAPAILPYLGLPPGWRFLIAPGYEDVWFDDALLDV